MRRLEKKILARILLKNPFLETVKGLGIVSGDFSPQAQIIFKSIHRVFKAGDPIDLVTLTKELKSKHLYEAAGGTEAIISLFDYVLEKTSK